MKEHNQNKQLHEIYLHPCFETVNWNIKHKQNSNEKTNIIHIKVMFKCSHLTKLPCYICVIIEGSYIFSKFNI